MKTLKIIFLLLVCLIYINAYDCTDYRFPITLGGTSSETSVTHVQIDGDYLFIAGTSADSSMLAASATKSAFIGKFNVNS